MVEQSKKYANGSSGSSEVVSTDIMVRSSFAESQSRGETDIQIVTAKRYPRSIARVQEQAMALATLDEETAESMFYVLPSRSDDGKPIEGPSVRLAEIIASSWTNMRAKTSIVDDDGKFITAQGVAWDLESNLCVSIDVRRSVTKKNGQRYSTDMIAVTANAACAIAFRNAVFKIVPKSLVTPIYLAAKKVAIGDASSLVTKRASAIEGFGKMGITPDRICLCLSKPSVADITLDDIGILRGFYTAIRDGETTIDEVFPKPEPKKALATEEDKAKLKSALDELKGSGKPTTDIEPKLNPDFPNEAHFRNQLMEHIANARNDDDLGAVVMTATDRYEDANISPECLGEIQAAVKAAKGVK